MRWVRGVLYAVIIPLAIVIPRSSPNERACPYSVILAPKYIGQEVGIIERKDQLVVMYGGVCNTYIGFPFIYIADLYDVKPAHVSLTLLALNIFIIVIVFEAIVFGVIKIGKSIKNEIN